MQRRRLALFGLLISLVFLPFLLPMKSVPAIAQGNDTTERVSVASDGSQGNQGSYLSSISADGRYVAFISNANNLVNGDTNGYSDVFIPNQQTGVADLSITQSASPDPATVGEQLTYTINVTNYGPSNATGVSAADTLPTGVAFISAVSSQGSCSGTSTVTCNLGSLAIGSTATVTIAVTPMTTGLITDTASVTGTTLDPNLTNNVSEIPITVSAPSTYSISGRVTDNGGNPIAGVTVSAGGGGSVTTDSNGDYSLGGLATDTYLVKPLKTGISFSPPSRTISVPPSQAGQNFIGSALPSSLGPPLILVHGIQLFSLDGYSCEQEIKRYGETPSTLDNLPVWLRQDYDVWIAHLTTSILHTPSLEDNAECLKKQIQQVYATTGKKVVIVAHSMGGLVSRGCLAQTDCRDKVEALYTLGSPHAGVNMDLLGKVVLKLAENYLKAHGIPLPITDGICTWQPAVCEMSTDGMVWFNTANPNQSNVKYTFIGGDVTPRWPGWLLWPTEGSNDGFVGRYSAIGWTYPFKWYVPPWWANNGKSLARYWTDEVHMADWGNAYYETRDTGGSSQSFHCIEWQQGQGSNPGYCRDVTSAASLTTATTPPALSETTISLDGHLMSNETATRTIQVDTANHSLFYLSWVIGTLNISLTRPDGQIINPAYVAANPNVVAYTVSPQSAEFPASATYVFTNTQPGLWTLNITAGDVGSKGVDYLAFVAMETDRSLSFSPNASLYHIGDTATFTATLKRGSTGIGGATVIASLRRPDNITDTLTLAYQGNGIYKGNYTIPNAPGYIVTTITAQGDDGGTPFTRQEDTLIAVASPTAQLSGSYADHVEDTNGDNSYESLVFEAGLSASQVGTYTISANLAKGETHIANTTIYKVLATGIQTVTLRFDGNDIRDSGLDGPYTISDLIVTDLKKGGIPAVVATNVWTTAAYQSSQFESGSQKIYLPIILK